MKYPFRLLSGITKFFFFFLIINSRNQLYSQYKEKCESRIESLISLGIDTILLYTPFSGNATTVHKKNYIILSSAYIIWSHENSYYIQKFSDCLDSMGAAYFDFAFAPIQLREISAYKYFQTNIENLGKEYMKPGFMRDKFQGRDTLVEWKGFHNSNTSVTYYINGKKYSNSYYDFQVYDGTIRNDDGSIRAKRESINYQYNISTAIYKLTNQLSELVNDLENAGAFDKHGFVSEKNMK